MKKYQFKTNINCTGCVAKVTPHLDNKSEIKDWSVDTTTPNKVLTVETENLNESQVKNLVEQAGFRAETL